MLSAHLKRRFIGVGMNIGGSIIDMLRLAANSRMAIKASPASEKFSLMSMLNIEREMTLMANRIISKLIVSMSPPRCSRSQRSIIWLVESTMISANCATARGV